MTDPYELTAFLCNGMLTAWPARKKKRLAALAWLADRIPPEKTYTEQEFNELLNKLHTFGDPAALRRELADHALVDRASDGTGYRLAPERPSLEALWEKYCGGAGGTVRPEDDPAAAPLDAGTYSDSDLAAAAEFRNRIHAEALTVVRRIRPEADSVIDRFAVHEYLRQHWDYPGAWYTVTAIPERVKNREALINTIVSDTLVRYR